MRREEEEFDTAEVELDVERGKMEEGEGEESDE